MRCEARRCEGRADGPLCPRPRSLWPGPSRLPDDCGGTGSLDHSLPAPEQVVARFVVGAARLEHIPPFGPMMEVGQPLSPDGRKLAFVAS